MPTGVKPMTGQEERCTTCPHSPDMPLFREHVNLPTNAGNFRGRILDETHH